MLLAALLYALGTMPEIESFGLRMAHRTVLLAIFIIYIIRRDLPLSQIPIVNRFIKKK